MTIVLQHQFWDLTVDGHGFQVTLSFGGTKHRLRVPFAAVSGFADPGVNFGLQLEEIATAGEDGTTRPAAEEEDATGGEAPATEEAPETDERQSGDVIALDAFRKK